MLNIRNRVVTLVAMLGLLPAFAVSADTVDLATVAVRGYDVVAYHTEGKPVRGTGHFVSELEGVTYLFASEENKAQFDANPAQYAPAYGGFCAYGVSAGKKFYADPDAWRIVDGKLYLNLDAKVQKLWLEDVPGYITKADAQWTTIKDTHPSQL